MDLKINKKHTLSGMLTDGKQVANNSPIGKPSGPIFTTVAFSIFDVLTCRGLLKLLPFWLMDFQRFSVSEAQFVTADRSMHGGMRANKRARSWRLLLLLSTCIFRLGRSVNREKSGSVRKTISRVEHAACSRLFQRNQLDLFNYKVR